MFKTLQNVAVYKKQKNDKTGGDAGVDAEETLADGLVSFVRSETPLVDFIALLEIHNKRAEERAIGLDAVADVVTSLQSQTSVAGLLSTWYSNSF